MQTASSLRKHSVLVIDDEPFILEYVSKVLQEDGYGTFVAEDGGRGLAFFEEHRAEIDLVLTDIVMPDSIDGLELAEKIRRIDSSVPILFITGAVAENDTRIVQLKKTDRLLRKPFFPNQLLQFVARNVENLRLAV
jgi:two-component system, cell cycle sensor histidine kinase and response regulator CckA